MKEWFERLGCLVWVIVIFLFAAGAGYLANNILGYVPWMPVWANVVLSIIAGIIALGVFGAISFIILVATDKNYDVTCPDFSGKV